MKEKEWFVFVIKINIKFYAMQTINEISFQSLLLSSKKLIKKFLLNHKFNLNIIKGKIFKKYFNHKMKVN